MSARKEQLRGCLGCRKYQFMCDGGPVSGSGACVCNGYETLDEWCRRQAAKVDAECRMTLRLLALAAAAAVLGVAVWALA